MVVCAGDVVDSDCVVVGGGGVVGGGCVVG